MKEPSPQASKSVQKTKKPQGNSAAHSDFRIIHSQKTVRNVLDLLKCFSLAADFKEISAVDKKVSNPRVCYRIACRAKLIQEEGFSCTANDERA